MRSSGDFNQTLCLTSTCMSFPVAMVLQLHGLSSALPPDPGLPLRTSFLQDWVCGCILLLLVSKPQPSH